MFLLTAGFSQKFETLAMTPPMGWNSWNRFGCEVNEQLVRDAADAQVSGSAEEQSASNRTILKRYIDKKELAKQMDINGFRIFPKNIKGHSSRALQLRFNFINIDKNCF